MATTLLRPLTTEAEVRAELGNKDTSPEITEKILVSINVTSRALERTTGRRWGIYDLQTAAPLLGYLDAGLWHSNDPDLLAGIGTDLLADEAKLYLPLAPIISIASVTENTVALVFGTDYLIDRRNGFLLRLGMSVTVATQADLEPKAPRWGNRVSIVGKLGYDDSDDPEAPAPELPGDLRQAATKIAAAWSGEMRRDQVTFDGRRVPYVDKAVPVDAYKLLRPYIRSNT